MQRILSFGFLTAILLLSTAFVFAQAKDNQEEQLKSLVQQIVDAQRKFDQAALNNLLTADYIEISPAGEFDPREKVIGFYDPKLNEGKTDVLASATADEYSIRNYGDTAIVIARLNFTPKAAEGQPAPPTMRMRATFVCRKTKGKWLIASAQYTGIRPPRPQAAK